MAVESLVPKHRHSAIPEYWYSILFGEYQYSKFFFTGTILTTISQFSCCCPKLILLLPGPVENCFCTGGFSVLRMKLGHNGKIAALGSTNSGNVNKRERGGETTNFSIAASALTFCMLSHAAILASSVSNLTSNKKKKY